MGRRTNGDCTPFDSAMGICQDVPAGGRPRSSAEAHREEPTMTTTPSVLDITQHDNVAARAGDKLRKRVAFVTGGTRGIGAAICRSLTSPGATLAARYAGDDDARGRRGGRPRPRARRRRSPGRAGYRPAPPHPPPPRPPSTRATWATPATAGAPSTR